MYYKLIIDNLGTMVHDIIAHIMRAIIFLDGFRLNLSIYWKQAV